MKQTPAAATSAPTPAQPRLVYEVREFAQRMNMSPHAVYEAIKRGELPVVAIGRRRFLPGAWVEGLRHINLPTTEPAGATPPAKPAAAAK